MSGQQENMDILCRLCLCDDGKVPIFPNGPDSDLAHRIFQCVAVQVEKDGKLPLNVCSGCISCIDSWFLFREKCHKTQDRLQSMVEKTAPQNVLVDPDCNGGGRLAEEELETSEAIKPNDAIRADTSQVDAVAEKMATAADDDISQAATESSGLEEQRSAEGSSAVAEVAEGPPEKDQSKSVDSPNPQSVVSNKPAESEQPKNSQVGAFGTVAQASVDADDEAMDEDDEYEDFEEDLDEFDEPESAQLINPKFAAKLMNMKHEAAQKLDSAAQQSNLRKADSTGATPPRPITVNLCEEEEEEEDDEDVAVIEPVIEKINLDPPEQITSTVSHDSASLEVVPKATAPKDAPSLRIQSAVTLPAPGDLFDKDHPKQDSALLPGEAEESEQLPSAGTSCDNSPDRMSVVEDDQFEDEGMSLDGASAPQSVGDPNRTTPDSTMITANQEDNEESQLSMDILIKEETMRGYADEEEASMASFESGSSGLPGDKTRDEYLREMLLSDPTVDVNRDKCIICDHIFYTVSSLLRHTKCRMHLDTRAIWELQQKGQEVDPVLLAMHQRKLDSYRLTWNISRKRVTPVPEGPRPPGSKKFTCRPCKVSACSYRDWDRHKNSKKHKLIMMLGEMPSEEELSEKKAPRKVVRPQPLQYDHSQPPQHLPKPVRPKMPDQSIPGQPMPGQSNREYICPIPNCGYICYEGPLLLTHMTSHGIQGSAHVQQMQKPMQKTPRPIQTTPRPMQTTTQPMQALQPLQTSTPISQPKPALSQPQPVGSSFPQHQQRPYKVLQKYENLFCKYHNIFFETARGYLNHIRHCAMAPPISTFLRPEYKGGTSDKRYCKLCDLSFSTPDMLIQHMGVYHRGSTVQQEMSRPAVPVYMPKAMPSAKTGVKHKCHLCGKVFNLLHSLNFHLRSHRQQVSSSTPGNTTCKVCKKTFLTRKSCATHLKTHFLHPGSNKMFCSLCYKTFDTRSEIARHRYDGTCHTPLPAAGPFNCDQCDFQCKDSTTLSNHRLKFHTDIKEEKPDEEEQDVDMMEHEEGEESQREPPSEPQQEHHQHEQEHHQHEQEQQQEHHQQQQQTEQPQPHMPEVDHAEEHCKCLLCGKTFYSYANVKRHCRFIHRMPDSKVDNMIKMLGRSVGGTPKGPRLGPPPLTPFRKPPIVNRTCGRCGENFTNKHLFEEHLLSCNEVAHESACEQCGAMCGAEGCVNCSQGTSQKSETGGLLFKCPIGHMSFSDENAMLKHYSYCTGNCGPYFECGNCGCEFRYRKNFDIHNCALAKKKTTYDCTECRRSFSKKIYLINHEMKCPGVNSSGGLAETSPGTSYSSNSAKKTRQSGPIEEEDVEEAPAATEPQTLQVFSCGSCERIFHSSKALCGHMRSHKQVPPEDPMFCKFCGRENLILSNLYGHVYKCTKSLFMTEEVLTCEECSTFLSRYDTPKELSAKLHHHVLNCYPIPWYQNQGDTGGSEKLLCYICCHAFSSVEALTIHKAQHNRIRAKRGSPFLKSSTKKRPKFGYARPIKHEFDPNDMIEEEILESGDILPTTANPATATQFILNCQVCNRQFNDIDKLQNHEKVHGIVRQIVSESDGFENEEEQEQLQS